MNILSNTFGGDEGTAMLEIGHDLAPGAELYFHDCGEDLIAFNQAIDELIAAGCNIICDDRMGRGAVLPGWNDRKPCKATPA